jgi:hypothetical protein
MKTLIKFLIAAAIVFASWKSGSAYWRFYKLKDGAQEAALFGAAQSTAEIHNSVVELANELNLPLDPERVAVRRTLNHTYVTASYTEKVEVLPSFFYPWQFNLDVDVLTMTPPRDAQLPTK